MKYSTRFYFILFLVLFAFQGSACADFAQVVGGGAEASSSPKVSKNSSKNPLKKSSVKKTTYRSGRYYMVEENDTLESVSEKFGVPQEEIAQNNSILSSDELVAGSRIYIPKKKVEAKKSPPKKEKKPLAKKEKPLSKKEKMAAKKLPKEEKKSLDSSEVQQPKNVMAGGDKSDKFIWPVKGSVTSGYGARGKRTHDGIDIRADPGTAVVAARDGEVLYAQALTTYGRLVIIKHNGNYFTAYAHLKEILVQKGDKIRQGKKLGTVGRTGRATNNLLHFEIRHKTKAVDPLPLLPQGVMPILSREPGVI